MSGTPNNQHLRDREPLPTERGTLALGIRRGLVGTEILSEDFEDEPLAITETGTWVRDNSEAHTGTWSFKAEAISDGQTTDSDVNVPVGAQECTLWYKVDSEEGFDFFRILVDAVEVFSASGDTGWLQTSVDCDGASILTLRYEKDSSVASGADTAWVDDMVFQTASAPDVYRALTLDEDDLLRVTASATTAYGNLDGGVFPTSSTGADSLPDATYRAWSLLVTVGPVVVNGITVQAGFALARSADPGATVDGISWDATGGEVVVDALVES